MCYDVEVLGHTELKTIGLDLSLFILGQGAPIETYFLSNSCMKWKFY